MKTLYLLRHAKTEPGEATQQDHERRLLGRGQRDAMHLGEWLGKQLWRPDLVLCSSSVRTRQTLEQMNLGLAVPLQAQYSEQLYLASAGDLLQIVQQLDDTIRSAMIIGHNPGIHQLCLMLGQAGDAAHLASVEVSFPTCAMATIELGEQHWSQAGVKAGKLLGYYQPNERDD